jgi:hypothetical protein
VQTKLDYGANETGYLTGAFSKEPHLGIIAFVIQDAQRPARDQ